MFSKVSSACLYHFVPKEAGKKRNVMKKNQRAKECQRSDEGRWAKKKQHLSTTLKSPAVRAQAHSIRLDPSRNHYKEQSKQIFFLVSCAMKSQAVIGHWQEIAESFLNGMEINTAASRDFMPPTERIWNKANPLTATLKLLKRDVRFQSEITVDTLW